MNNKLKEKLGEPLAHYYYINRSRGEAFRINISPDYVHCDIRF